MNMLKAFIAATALTLMSGVTAAEGVPQTKFTLYHQADSTASERSSENGISVYDAEINLLDDYDHDGHYSRFEVTYDADDLSGHGLYAYTVVSLVDEDGDTHELFTSPTFYIYGDTNSDAQSHMITLLDNYQPGHYRLRIDLYGACCSDHLDTLITSSEEPIPLEGEYFDSDTYVEETVVVEHYHDDSGAGGAWGLGGVGALGLLYTLRRRRLEALLDTEDDEE